MLFLPLSGVITNNLPSQSLYEPINLFSMQIIEEYAQFFTAAIYGKYPLFDDVVCVKIVLDSLSFLNDDNRVNIYSFVIMNNHIHLIWQIKPPYTIIEVQRDFLKFTAQQFKFHLLNTSSDILEQFEVNRKDREFQFWQRNSLSIPVYTKDVLEQKLDYIHANPVKAGLCVEPCDYYLSSATFYERQDDRFTFLKHYEGRG